MKHRPSPAAEQHMKDSEGLALKMYKCPAGYNTIGWGFNLDANAIPPEVAQLLFEYSYGQAKVHAERICTGYWNGLGPWRQEAIIDMVFNLGPGRFGAFKKFQMALAKQDWKEAAKEMEASKWYKQVGNRSKRLKQVILKGCWE
jgi:lysozyme